MCHELSNGGIDLHADGQCRGDEKSSSSTRPANWFGQLLLLFSYKNRRNQKIEMAFVRWFDCVDSPAHAKDLRLQALRWAKIRVPGINGRVPQTDMVQLESITGPCLLQPDPLKRNEPLDSRVFYFNHWAGNAANLDVQVCWCPAAFLRVLCVMSHHPMITAWHVMS